MSNTENVSSAGRFCITHSCRKAFGVPNTVWSMGKRGPDEMDKSQEIRQLLMANERPFMGTGEVAEALGYESNPGVDLHLRRAQEKGAIEKTTISGYNVWYLPGLEDLEFEKPTVETTDSPGVLNRFARLVSNTEGNE